MKKLKPVKILLLLKLVPFIVAGIVTFAFTTEHGNIPVIQNPADSLISGSFEITAEFAAVGDLMCHSTQFNYARVDKDSFDFSGVFERVSGYLKNPDLLMGNFETTLAGTKYPLSGYPIFNTPDDFLTGLKNSGFDLLFTANNHSVDRGLHGIRRTIGKFKEQGIIYRGTNFTPEGKDTVDLIDVNGVKTVVLAYSYGDNGMGNSTTNQYLNTIDSLVIKKDMAKADSLQPDVIIVYLHFGVEYQKEPNVYQKDIVERVISYGADIILGSHPHVMQPIQYFKTNSSRLDTGFVAFSMGNFISNQRWRYSDAGIIVNFKISKNTLTGEKKLKELSFLPTWVFKGSTEKGKEYIIFPAEYALKDSVPEYFTAKDIWYMKESFFDTYSISRQYDKNIKLESIFGFSESELDSIKKTVPRSDNK